MIQYFYYLQLFYSNFLLDAFVITHEQFKSDVAAIPTKYDLKIKLDITCIPKNDEFGTADSLRLIQDKIKV